MNSKNKKSSSKTELFWNHFEKSGSIQAYLRFHQARQEGQNAQIKSGSKAKATAKKVVKSR
ncbi:MAG TPA: hypothetical protein VNZ54_07735 [bacterium]|nr:hypothetical protein [bacterium]